MELINTSIAAASEFIYDSGWVEKTGTSVTHRDNLYTNDTGKMLMLNVFRVSTEGSPAPSYYYPEIALEGGSKVSISTVKHAQNPSTDAQNVYYINGNSTEGYMSVFFFDNNIWIPVPAGAVVKMYASNTAFTASLKVSYRAKIKEFDEKEFFRRLWEL